MPRPDRAGKPFQLYLTDGLRAELVALAERNGRSLQGELLHAIRRHLAAPPVLDVPGLPAARLDSAPLADESPPPKRPRGRPRKNSANGVDTSTARE